MMNMLYSVICLMMTNKIFALPSDIKKCRIDDERCLHRSSNKVLTSFYRGLPEINLVPLDPFFIDYLKIVQDAGIVTVRGAANDTNIVGFSKGKIQKIAGFNESRLEVLIKVSKLTFSGKYTSIANVLGISINGEGAYKTIFNDFVGTIRMNLSRYENIGKTHFKVVDSTLAFDISGGSLDIPDLGYITNTFLNASFDLIVKRSLIGVISDAWSGFFQKAVSKVFEKVPIEVLFLE